ncbi:MAG TPA: DivIVA domain-containing protein, partial [Candidatus Luteococcus avicola]|nr:DivIVA domain-containing protein [Candidatus Luteococcus avicola]
MTLTLEDVKNVRFPIAKRQGEGYRATEVDDFVDAVDLTFVQMSEENERLRAQLDALGSDRETAGDPTNSSALADENARLQAEIEALRAQSSHAGPALNASDAVLNDSVSNDSVDAGELQRLREENAGLRSELDAARKEVEQARAEVSQIRGELDAARQATPLTVVDGDGAGRVEKIVVTTSAQASPAVVRMVQLHTEQAETLVSEAEAEAQRKVAEADARAQQAVSEAERRAHELTVDAQTRAERIQSEARVNADQLAHEAKAQADQLISEAAANSERVHADAEARRSELFSALEAERDALVGKVDDLRTYEGSYRSTLTEHLRGQIAHLENSTFEPEGTPVLLGEERPAIASQTPRLDALLAEGNN